MGRSHLVGPRSRVRWRAFPFGRRPAGPKQPLGPLATRFAGWLDARVERTQRHQLLDIALIAVCAGVCGADGRVEVEAFGQSKKKGLKPALALPHGSPAHGIALADLAHHDQGARPGRNAPDRDHRRPALPGRLAPGPGGAGPALGGPEPAEG